MATTSSKPQSLSDTDIAKLKAQKNTKFYADQGFRPDLVAEPQVVQAFVEKYRPVYESLCEENPSWDNRGILSYMYEQCEYFARMYDKWPSLVREICSTTFNAAKLDVVLQVLGNKSLNKVSAVKAIRDSNPHYTDSKAAVEADAMVDKINKKYKGKPETFCAEVLKRRQEKLKKLQKKATSFL